MVFNIDVVKKMMKPQLERRQAITNLPRYTKTLVDIALEPYKLDAAQAQEQGYLGIARQTGQTLPPPRQPSKQARRSLPVASLHYYPHSCPDGGWLDHLQMQLGSYDQNLPSFSHIKFKLVAYGPCTCTPGTVEFGIESTAPGVARQIDSTQERL
ncbi:hypothetical protein PoB_000725700 [Plakobranchus ocellatus]|uniref:Uncharacterized protein n=1 Tax=Plakobranchus ocellatus TaxID=259542 RepID=A0AAV3YF24_9GAST|nr:hypothetical protein PoB_000725700 [Plakobranchus ocellatus]